jgi:type II secretory pathway pseudopilin PulG
VRQWRPQVRQAAHHAGPDDGETLVELLMTLMIMGIAVAAIMGAMMLAVDASSLHRKQAQSQALLRNWAESVSKAPYTPCPGTPAVPPAPALPTGFSSSAPQVEYWDQDAGTFGACPVGGDGGVQKVTLGITAPNAALPGFSERLAVMVRKPCVSAC